jgi:hypothetical protein
MALCLAIERKLASEKLDRFRIAIDTLIGYNTSDHLSRLIRTNFQAVPIIL